MRTLLISSLLALVITLSYSQVGAEEKAGSESGKKLASVKQVSEKMADAWCLKLEECQTKGEMSDKECRKILKKSFNEGFKRPLNGQKVQVSRDKLSKCYDSIKQDSCGALKTAQNLPGCDFISLLNRQ